MAKEKLTQNKAKNSPAGGVVVGKRNGQTMVYDDASVGGYFVGKLHSEGGIKMINKSTGQQLEVQGSEVIITAPAVADQTKREFEGKMMTNREILSAINEKGGGVSFANGGDVPKSIKHTGARYKYGGKTMTDKEIADEINKCGCDHEEEKYENGGQMPKSVKSIVYDADGNRNIDDKSIATLTTYVNSLPQTKQLNLDSKTGNYTKKRQKLHEKIINTFKDKLVCIQKDEPIAILMGGSPASGKSTFLKKYAPYLLKEEILKVDADEIRAMLPEYKGYNASQTHQETKDIVNTLLSDRTIGIPCKYDIIYDGTMNSTKSYYPLIELLKKLNYKVFIVYIDKVPESVVKKRALERYQKSGRFVPMEVIEDFFDKGKDALNELKGKADGYMIIDGSSGDYNILEKKGIVLPKKRIYSKLGEPLSELEKFVVGGHLAEGMTLSQIAKMHKVSVKELQKQVDLGMKAESEHTSSKSEQMKIVKDHLFENPNYYTLLKKAGLEGGGGVEKWKKITEYNLIPALGITEEYKSYVYKNAKIYYSKIDREWLLEINNKIIKGYPTLAVAKKRAEMMLLDSFKNGGSLVRDSKKGDHPARDLNNYNDVLDMDADGMVGAETGLYADGGKVDLSFLDDVTKVFVEGGATDLPKVVSLKIDSTGTGVYGGLHGMEFSNYIDLIENLEQVFKDKNKVASYFYFKVNGTSDRFAIAFSTRKNTVLNFNPLTGTYKDFEKQILRRYPRSAKKYDWSDFLESKNRSGQKTTSATPTQTPTSTPTSSGKFSAGEIDVFNQIDNIVKEQGIKDVTTESIYFDNKTKDFIVENKQTNEVFIIRKYLDSLGAGFELAGKGQTKALIKDYLEWKASTPTSTNESKAIEVTSMIIDYIDKDGNTKKANIDNVFDLKKQLYTLQNNYDTLFVILYPIEGANPTGVQSRIYITKRPTSDIEDFNTLDSSIADLKEKLKLLFVAEGYKWDKFFNTEKESQTQTPTTPDPVKSNRNYELERKYLTGRINDLSKELDMKRPSLPNEEIAFYQREINKFVLKLRKVMNDQNEEKPIKERIEAVYGLKWGDYDKKYPETDLVSYNGVKSELTEEEYLTVRTPEFKAFFGDWEQGNSAGYSKAINPKTKEPLAVFHGTNVLFTEWKTYATNNAHYFAVKRDFSEFFASEWENRTDKAGVDSKVLKDLNPNKGKFMFRCFIDVRNPIDFSRFGVDKRPISDYLTFLKINYNIGDYDFWTGLGNASGVTKDTKVYAWQIIRLWQNFTTYVKLYTTYDGYIFYEYNPNTPSGGIDNASLCFCAFESNQVKFTNAYEFNALSNDSRFDFGGTI